MEDLDGIMLPVALKSSDGIILFRVNDVALQSDTIRKMMEEVRSKMEIEGIRMLIKSTHNILYQIPQIIIDRTSLIFQVQCYLRLSYISITVHAMPTMGSPMRRPKGGI